MIKILHGDCREILPTLPADSIDCCVTSPPYWMLRDYGVEGQIGMEPTPEAFIATLTAVFREVRRVLKPQGTCWVNMGDSYAGAAGGFQGKTIQRAGRTHTARVGRKMTEGLKGKDLVGIPWMLAFALRAEGWFLRQDIIWHKPNPMPESMTDRCTKAHEYIFLLSKSSSYYFDADAIKEKASENTHSRTAASKTPDGWDTSKGDGGHGTIHRQGREKGRKLGNRRESKNNASFDSALTVMPDHRNKRSVWTVPSAPFKEAHFATYPPNLIKPCILAGCPAGGTVLDPFGGSGTTGAVAEELGRNSTLIELSAKYIQIARRRTAVTAGLGL